STGQVRAQVAARVLGRDRLELAIDIAEVVLASEPLQLVHEHASSLPLGASREAEHEVKVRDAALLRLPHALEQRRRRPELAGELVRLRTLRREPSRVAQPRPSPRRAVGPLARGALLHTTAGRPAVPVPAPMRAMSLVPRQPILTRRGDRDEHHRAVLRGKVDRHDTAPVARPMHPAARAVAPLARTHPVIEARLGTLHVLAAVPVLDHVELRAAAEDHEARTSKYGRAESGSPAAEASASSSIHASRPACSASRAASTTQLLTSA